MPETLRDRLRKRQEERGADGGKAIDREALRARAAGRSEPAAAEPEAKLPDTSSLAYDPRIRSVAKPESLVFDTPEKKAKARDSLVTAMSVLAGGVAPGGLLARMGLLAGTGAGSSLGSEVIDPSSGPGEAAGRAIKSGAFNAATEAVGGGLAKAGGKVASGLFKPTPAGAAAAKAIEAEGGVLTPALQSESRLAKNIESVAESSFGGSETIANTRAAATQAALKPIERFVDGMRSGFSREELGGIAQEALEGKAEAFKAAASVAYGEVDKVLKATPAAAGQPAVGVSLRGLKSTAESMLKSGLPSSNAGRQLREVLALPDEVSFQKAAEIRSDLINPVSETGKLLVGKAKGQVKRLAALADRAMDESFATASVGRRAQGEALRLWREANALYKEGAELFNAKMVKALVTKEPEAVVQAITQAQKPGTIRRLKSAVGDEKVWRGIQGEFLSDLLTKNTDTAGDIARGTQVSGQKISTALKNFGDPALKELLGAPQADAFKRMVKVLERSQQRTGAGLGGLNFRGGTEGLGLGLALAGNPQGIVIALTPTVIAKLFTNPRSVRVLTQGFNAPAGSAEATRAMAQLTAMLATDAPEPQPERAQ